MKTREPRDLEWTRRYTERLIEGFSAVNRGAFEGFVRAKQSEGCKTNTVSLYAITLKRFDEHLNGGDATTASAAQIALFLNGLRHGSRSTLDGHTTRLRAFYRWHYDMLDQDVPRPLRRALRRLPTNEAAALHEPVVTHEEFNQLLAAARERRGAEDALRVQALLWVLWDAGFRVGELLNLRVRSVHPDGQGGAELRLVPQREGLKTGIRNVHIAYAYRPLQAWLSVHPQRNDPDALIFAPNRVNAETAWPLAVGDLVGRLCKRAGIRHVRPHLFRHTAATRDAENTWNEAMLRAKYGWSSNSAMPAHYVHLAQSKLAERTRQDAGITTTGHASTSDEKTCPACAEVIKAAAVKCKHCGEFMTGPAPTANAEGGSGKHGSARI